MVETRSSRKKSEAEKAEAERSEEAALSSPADRSNGSSNAARTFTGTSSASGEEEEAAGLEAGIASLAVSDGANAKVAVKHVSAPCPSSNAASGTSIRGNSAGGTPQDDASSNGDDNGTPPADTEVTFSAVKSRITIKKCANTISQSVDLDGEKTSESPMTENVEGKKANPSAEPQEYLPSKVTCVIVSGRNDTEEFFVLLDNPGLWGKGTFELFVGGKDSNDGAVDFVTAQKATVLDINGEILKELTKGNSTTIRSGFKIRVGRAEYKITIIPLAPARIKEDEDNKVEKWELGLLQKALSIRGKDVRGRKN